MGQTRVGTAGWTDKSLIDSGWYPPDAGNPENSHVNAGQLAGLIASR